MQLSESEEFIEALSIGEGECSKQKSDNEFKNLHVVACLGEEEEDGKKTPKPDLSKPSLSVSSAEGDSDSDFHPSDSEGATGSRSQFASSHDDSTAEEETSATSTEISNPP